VAVPGTSLEPIVLQGSKSAATGSKAGPACGLSAPGAIVWAAALSRRISPGAARDQLPALRGPSDGADFGQVVVSVSTLELGAAPIPFR
jgi:hypothetical protein